MKSETEKKTLLGTAVALIPVATTMFSNGQYIEGIVVTAMSVVLVLAYDRLDDNLKLPKGVDKETFVEIAEDVDDAVDSTSSNGSEDG